jgi:uncharacterized YigZ family protein
MGVPRVPVGTHRTETLVVNSRFVCTIMRAATPDEARACVDAVKGELTDASSTAYAFCAGHGASVTHGCSDGGEPKGTAGQPMLAVLKGSGLADVVAVVSRYFGGTKLGTGGLVRAFGDAVRDALLTLPTEEKIDYTCVQLTLGYADFEPARRLIQTHGATVLEETFEANVVQRIRLPADAWPALQQALIDLTAGRVRIARPPA